MDLITYMTLTLPWGDPRPVWVHYWRPWAPPSCGVSAPSVGTGWSARWWGRTGYGTSCWSSGRGSWSAAGRFPGPYTRPAVPSYTENPGRCPYPSTATTKGQGHCLYPSTTTTQGHCVKLQQKVKAIVNILQQLQHKVKVIVSYNKKPRSLSVSINDYNKRSRSLNITTMKGQVSFSDVASTLA